MGYRVRLEPLGIELQVQHGLCLHDVIADCGIEFPCSGHGICGRCKVRLLKGNIVVDARHAAVLRDKGLGDEWRLACFSRITDNVTIYIDQCDCSVQTDETMIHFVPEDGYGIAVDLGSTTLAAQLLNLSTGKVEGVATAMNPQSRYGADIIARISFALENSGGGERLCQLIRTEVGRLLSDLKKQCQGDIRKITIVGNTVMHHLFCGYEVAPLSSYPFQTTHLEERIFSAVELGYDFLSADCNICFLPNISHFVGSDVLAGILATGIYRSERPCVLLDLGTNGEIVVGNAQKMVCTSTAAGPAFEGVHIVHGMRASTGAIHHVLLDAGEMNCQVIGSVAARGICGSGLVSAIHALLQSEKLDAFGTSIPVGTTFFPLEGKVGLTDRDIREFQLAKAAVSAGLHLLLNRLQLSIDDVEHVYLTGGLGNYLHYEAAKGTGLLELTSERQLVKIGNAALMGAKQLLFDVQQSENQISQLLSRIEYCSLETLPEFMNVYCEKMMLCEK